MWSASAFFESLSAQRIDDGDWSGPINAFAFLLYDNPGLQQLWLEKLARKERFFSQFNRGVAFFELNDRVREKLAGLPEQEN